MNLFLDYQEKIIKILKKLEKSKVIKISDNLKNLTIELPPKEQKQHFFNDYMNAKVIFLQKNAINCGTD